MAPAPLPSLTPPADSERRHGLDLVEKFDGYAGLRNALRSISEQRGDWAGIPMPIEGEKLIINPKFPMAAELAEIGAPKPAETPSNIKIRNTFYSHRMRCDIMIGEDDGKIVWNYQPAFHHLGYDLSTLMCSDAWGIEQESNAVQLLGTLVKHRQMKQYLLTGMFLESSKRSGLTYMFRRLKPTVVIDAKETTSQRSVRILCTLCMHPIAFYAGSWAGAMCPTDDVIAHLMLMRADEPLLWRRANQHPPHRPEAGL